jgi:hypothetical protein
MRRLDSDPEETAVPFAATLLLWRRGEWAHAGVLGPRHHRGQPSADAQGEAEEGEEMTSTRRGFLRTAAIGPVAAMVPTMTPRGAADRYNGYDAELERKFPGAWRRITLKKGDAPFSMRHWVGQGWMLLRSEPPYDGEWMRLVNLPPGHRDYNVNGPSSIVGQDVDLWFVKTSYVAGRTRTSLAPDPARK